jgi:hypothetical protein
MKTLNSLPGLIALAMTISFFFPWFEVTSKSEVMGYSASYSSGGISGIWAAGGFIGFGLSIAAAVLAGRKYKYSVIIGAILLLTGLYNVLGFGAASASSSGSFSSSFGDASVSASYSPRLALFVFILLSAAYTAITFKFFRTVETPVAPAPERTEV